MPSHDISITVATEHFPNRTVISVEVAEGNKRHRADVVAMVTEHLDTLWAELARRIKAGEHQVQVDIKHRGRRLSA